MSRLLSTASVFLFVSPLLAQAEAQKKDPLVVHEWGTFTSMQGSDGVGLEGLQHEEERLPGFVYSRTEVRECPLRAYGYKGLEVPVQRVTQKMETPVIYFYSRQPRQVRVRVDFVRGLLTQWYPVTDLLGPKELGMKEGPLDLRKVDRSFLEWDLQLVPRTAGAPEELPEVAKGDPWALAREVKAAWVKTRPRQAAGRMGPVEAEQYLFYRGLGTFRMPLRVEAGAQGRARLIYGGAARIPAAIAMELGPRGGRLRILGRVAPKSKRAYDLGKARWQPAEDFREQLGMILTKFLVAEGLFADEARAMVRTWSRSWFLTPGSRVLYLVPRKRVDAILPLRIQPQPDQLVRVLVGRLEYLSPEIEAQVAVDLKNWDAADPALQAGARRRLMALDRFLEPHLHRALARSEDPQLQRVGKRLLTQLRR